MIDTIVQSDDQQMIINEMDLCWFFLLGTHAEQSLSFLMSFLPSFMCRRNNESQWPTTAMMATYVAKYIATIGIELFG